MRLVALAAPVVTAGPARAETAQTDWETTAWQDWSEAAFARARREGRFVLRT